MTPIDDLELSRRLRALRVDPPANGFEARLAERLSGALPESTPEAPPAGAGARVVLGPWRRRGVVPLIGAAALFVAGAAAALEGGVVEWVQARVFSRASAPAEHVTTPASPREAPARRAAQSLPAVEPPRLEPARAAEGAPPALAEPRPALDVPRLDVQRVDARRPERARELVRVPERRGGSEPLSVPRVELAPRATDRRGDSDGRVDRIAPRAGAGLPVERGRELERVRELARARREQGGALDRARLMERVRERRDRVDGERRELRLERERRERPIR